VGQPSKATLLAAHALSHVDALYAFAWRLARDGAIADDLVQETFARCMSHSDRFEEGTNLKAWLFRILRNLFFDLRRRENRYLPDTLIESESASLSAPDVLRGDPEIARLKNLVAADIDAALQALTDDQRTVVLLDLEGFSEREIADVMTCAPGTVKSRLARARAALREKLWEYAT
jgi:RNA polymerase sigma-70 factor (ECF subfamily)